MSKKNKGLVPALRFPEFKGNEGWLFIKLGSFGKVSMCKRILKDETKTEGEIPFYKIGTFGKQADAYIDKELFDKYKRKYSYPSKGEILISASGTIGRLVVFDGKDAYFQDSNIVWIKNNEELVINSFLYYCYKNTKWATDDNTISRLYNDNLRGMEISITSIPEQQKIADCLSSLDDTIAGHTKKLEVLQLYKKGLMQNLFPAEGETTPKLRFLEFNQSWCRAKLSEHIKLLSGYAFKSEHFSENGMKILTPKNFTKNGFSNFNKLNTKYSLENYDEKYICKDGDLLLLLTDLTPSCELLGKPLLLVKNDGDVLLNQRIVKIIPKNNIAIRFLLYFFFTDSYSKSIKDTATGSTVRHSSNKIVLNTEIFVPSQKEQQKIADCLSSLDNIITNQSKKIEALKLHKKGLMQQLFPSQELLEA